MAVHVTRHREGFGPGYTRVTEIGEAEHDTGIELGVLKLGAGEVLEETVAIETAWLLMSGEVTFTAAGERASFTRVSLFDDPPAALHVGAGERVRIEATGEVELTVYRANNRASFPAELHRPESVKNERRGKGGLKDTAYRFVRTIFDDSNSHPNAALVLGEVVTFPGRWSSYPPHHHAQPEIYHYRFTAPQGYGHAELGDDVLKVRPYDTIKILDGNDHPQCAAPGYGMYYAWVIRHLEGNRYGVPEFVEEHRWTMKPDAKHWWPHDQD
jgi:5-deoxy-glucuronate isomerase